MAKQGEAGRKAVGKVTLLQEIINLATDNKEPLSVLLRKCLILGTRIKNDQLRSWAQKELDGYRNEDALPEYRMVHTIARGTFRGPFGASIQNQPLPSSVLEEKHRRFATTAHLTQPAASYDQLLQQEDLDGTFAIHWSPDLVVRYQSKFYDGYALAHAWQELSVSSLVGLVDTIRNRILNFCLELEGSLESPDQDPAEIPKEKVSQYVTNYIFGGQNVISGRMGDVSQVGPVNVQTGDFAALADVLRAVGIEEADIGRLREAVLDDERAQQPEGGGLGPKVSKWLGAALKAAATGTMKVSADVAQAAITKAMMGYLGLS